MSDELLDIRKQVEQIAQDAKKSTKQICSKQKKFRQNINDYNEKRVELFLEELHTREMGWCTRCSKEFPKSEIKLIFIEGRERYDCGYENSCYSFRNFSDLHNACPECCRKAFDKHGYRGTYDTWAKNQTSFLAFYVEKRDDGYYARKFGNWEKLEDKSCKLPDPPDHLVDRLMAEWGMLPRVELDSDNELIVHE